MGAVINNITLYIIRTSGGGSDGGVGGDWVTLGDGGLGGR